MNISKLLFVMVTALYTVGCAATENTEGPEWGAIWCNERILTAEHDRLQKIGGGNVFHQQYYDVAKRGYIYSLAAALALQDAKLDEDLKHYYKAPERMELVHVMPPNSMDFEARIFKLFKTEHRKQLDKIIVAFSGTNSTKDWRANLFPVSGREHYAFARAYVLNQITSMKKEYGNVDVVVAGYSLGGGLAVHVTKHEDTSHLVDEAWAFNASPKTYADGKPDKRIWAASVDNEALVYVRWLFRILPGMSELGAPGNQRADEFPLVRATPFYAHSRWLLAREMLHVADLALYIDAQKNGEYLETSEPLQILQDSKSVGCSR